MKFNTLQEAFYEKASSKKGQSAMNLLEKGSSKEAFYEKASSKKGQSAMEYLNLLGKGSSKAQSAMEYLMTYGWSILLIAIVLVAMFELGVFGNSGSLPTSCIAQQGFLCSNPSMNTAGNVVVTFGQTLGSKLYITGTSCVNNTSPPTGPHWIATSALVSSGEITLSFYCHVSSNAVGTPFSGTLWIQYGEGSPTAQTQVSEIAALTAKSITSNSLGAPPPTPSYSGLTVSYVYSSGITSASTTINSGTLFLCGGASGDGFGTQVTLTSSSWTTTNSDTMGYSNVGNQLSSTCSDSTSPGNTVTVGGIGIVNPPSQYSVYSANEVGVVYSNYALTYTLTTTSSVAILFACGGGLQGDYPACYSVSIPPGCSWLFQNNLYSYSSVEGAYCQVQDPGTYSIGLTSNNQGSGVGVSAEAYAFPASCSEVGFGVLTSESSSVLSYGGSSTFTSNVSCGTQPYYYQWYEEAPGASSFTPIAGATASTYTFSPTGGAKMGAYQFEVKVIDAQNNQVVSSVMTVTYVAGPVAYVTNANSNNVVIINTTTNTIAAAMTSGLSNPYGVAFSPSGAYAYVTNGGSSNVVIINNATHIITNSITSGFNSPFGVAFSPSGAYAYVTNGGSSNVVIINTATNTVVNAITFGIDDPYGVAFSPSGAYAYVINYGSGNVVIINTATNTVVNAINSGFDSPRGVAFSPSGAYAYVTNYFSGNVVIINTATNTVVNAITSGINYPYGVAFSPSGAYAYVTNGGSSNVVIINTATNTVVNAITSGFNSPFGVAVPS